MPVFTISDPVAADLLGSDVQWEVEEVVDMVESWRMKVKFPDARVPKGKRAKMERYDYHIAFKVKYLLFLLAITFCRHRQLTKLVY